jgi:hypothetical protein
LEARLEIFLPKQVVEVVDTSLLKVFERGIDLRRKAKGILSTDIVAAVCREDPGRARTAFATSVPAHGTNGTTARRTITTAASASSAVATVKLTSWYQRLLIAIGA